MVDHHRFGCAPRLFASINACYSRRSMLRHGAGGIIALGLASVACAQPDLVLDRFDDITRSDIPDTAPGVRTRGWGIAGIGAARYVFDPRVDWAWVRRYPRSSAISANGRGFRLDAIGGDARCYGAVGDGRSDDSAAINEALACGGTVVLPGPATYFVSDRLLLPIARTRLVLANSVTLRTSAWRYHGQQLPFGNAVHVTGDDCEVVGAGADSVIESVGSDANGIGFLHCGGGRIAGLTLKGGKDGLTAIVDDTFQSGISIVNDRANSTSNQISRTIIEDCTLIDWMQYGINVYGDLAADIVIRRTTIMHSGKVDDHKSVGAGIAFTRGVGPILADNNVIANNKAFGIFVSSAGVEVHDITIIRNRITGNGMDGIRCSEERHFSSVDAIGQRNVVISENRIEANGGMGVRAGTFDGIGSIDKLVITHNRLSANRGSGVLLQANDIVGRGVEATVSANDFIANGDYGLAVGLNRINLRHAGNRFERNRNGQTIDYRSGSARALVETGQHGP